MIFQAWNVHCYDTVAADERPTTPQSLILWKKQSQEEMRLEK